MGLSGDKFIRVFVIMMVCSKPENLIPGIKEIAFPRRCDPDFGIVTTSGVDSIVAKIEAKGNKISKNMHRIFDLSIPNCQLTYLWDEPVIVSGVTNIVEKSFPLINVHDCLCSKIPVIHEFFFLLVAIGIDSDKTISA